MNQEMTVVGRPTGDGACCCLEVTETEYRRVVGEEAYIAEKASREELREEMGHTFKYRPGQWYLYPTDLLNALGITERNQAYEFKIVVRSPA